MGACSLNAPEFSMQCSWMNDSSGIRGTKLPNTRRSLRSAILRLESFTVGIDAEWEDDQSKAHAFAEMLKFIHPRVIYNTLHSS